MQAHKLAFLTFFFPFFLLPTTFAAECLQGRALFYLQAGKKVPLCVSNNLVAVAGGRSNAKSALPENATSTLAMTGLKVVQVEAQIPKHSIAGIPVWFGDDQKVPAILTSDIVVKFKSAVTKADVEIFFRSKAIRKLRVPGYIYIVSYPSPLLALTAANQLSLDENISYSHPDFMIAKNFRKSENFTGMDEFYHLQWHLKNTGQTGGTVTADLNIEPAFAITSGSPGTVIAIVDGGVEIDHEDLKDGIFVNALEIADNQIDDDANGYIDDLNGWNFYRKNPDVSTGLNVAHGTPVAGTVGARSNSIGTSGTCPGCAILPVAAGWTVSADAEAMHYSDSMGAAVISNSWGYPLETPATDVMIDALDRLSSNGRNGKGALILFAMNNVNQDDCIGSNPDISSLNSVIAISSSDDKDKKVRMSAYGPCMDFLSPSANYIGGGDIVTTDMSGDHGYHTLRSGDDLIANLDYTSNFGGTSAATPSVAGIIGLMLTVNPNLTRTEVIEILKQTSDKIDAENAAYDVSGFSRSHGWGRVNAGAAVARANKPTKP